MLNTVLSSEVYCPICKGTGRIGWYQEITCHGCEGKGLVEVRDRDTLNHLGQFQNHTIPETAYHPETII